MNSSRLPIDWSVFTFLELHRLYPRYFGREKWIVYSREELLALVRENLGRKELVVSLNYYLVQRNGHLENLVVRRVALPFQNVPVFGYYFRAGEREILITRDLRSLPPSIEIWEDIMVPFPLQGLYLRFSPLSSIDEGKPERRDEELASGSKQNPACSRTSV